MRKIKRIVIHCSDSPDSIDFGARDIKDWHLERGWSDIGYHWVVRRSGIVEKGRDESIAGAHVAGHNKDTIGICWVGRDKPAPKQLDGLLRLVARVGRAYGLGPLDVYGHYELDGRKTCPNFDMDWFRAELLFTKGE